jgi:hypothetical protein
VNASNKPSDRQPFPIFASLKEAEGYSDKIGNACFEMAALEL